jgi:hypothetical protein
MKYSLPRSSLVVAVLAIFVLVLLLWIRGPADFAKLKDWQPLLAAAILFGGAVIAYRAAMAKVNLDRELAERAIMRKRLALYLRLEFGLQNLAREAGAIREITKFVVLSGDKKIRAQDLHMTEPPEITEAWGYLDAFQNQTVSALRTIRVSLRNSEAMLTKCENKEWAKSTLLPGDAPWEIRNLAEAISVACESALSHLATNIIETSKRAA